MLPSSRRLKILDENPESVSIKPYVSENSESPSNSEESSFMLTNARSDESISELAIDAQPDVGLE